MSMNHFQAVIAVALLLPFSTVPFAPTPRQRQAGLGIRNHQAARGELPNQPVN